MKKTISSAVGIVVVVIVILAIGYFVNHSKNENKIAEIQNIFSWERLTDNVQGLTFQYPKSLETKYITPVAWPPQAQTADGAFVCNESGSQITSNGKTEKVMIDNNVYCLNRESEGAAGSIYTQYTYTTEKNSKLETLKFNLRTVQCENYDDPQKTECKNEQSTFDVNSLVNKIFGTMQLIPVVATDYKNATYLIDGKEVTLTNGLSEQEISSSSASKIVTRFFGNEAEGYYNNDKVKDIAFLLTQNTGGSGTFYYLAVALGAGDGFVGTNTILLGDRIAPQNTSFRDWQIVVNYAERKPGEPFTTRPSLGVSRYFKVIDNKLVEVKK